MGDPQAGLWDSDPKRDIHEAPLRWRESSVSLQQIGASHLHRTQWIQGNFPNRQGDLRKGGIKQNIIKKNNEHPAHTLLYICIVLEFVDIQRLATAIG